MFGTKSAFLLGMFKTNILNVNSWFGKHSFFQMKVRICPISLPKVYIKRGKQKTVVP